MSEVLERDLVAIAPADALAVFTGKSPIDPILERVRKEIDAFDADVSTAGGRKAIASMANKVAKSKTYLDGVGKTLVDEYKEIPKKIDATRKHIRDTLDLWKAEVRQPLTDWEEAQAAREAEIKRALSVLEEAIGDRERRHSQYLKDWLGDIEALPLTVEKYGDYLGAAAELKEAAVKSLTSRILFAQQTEAEQAELAKLRAEAAERERLDREADMREQAARDAQKRADATVQAEREAAAKREAELERQKAELEQRAVDAAAKAKREIEEAARAEQQERERRESDTKHKASINRAALQAFVAAGVPEDTAKSVIKLIAAKAIPAITIHY